MSLRGSTRSGRFDTAAARLPTTKPTCTTTTGHAAPAPVSAQSRSSAGTMAVALNQVALTSTAADATRANAARAAVSRRRAACPVIVRRRAAAGCHTRSSTVTRLRHDHGRSG
jgi:hypothetical protein